MYNYKLISAKNTINMQAENLVKLERDNEELNSKYYFKVKEYGELVNKHIELEVKFKDLELKLSNSINEKVVIDLVCYTFILISILVT